MKIAQVFSTPWPPREGIGSYVRGLTEQLVAAGHDVVLATRGGRNAVVHDDGLGVDVHTFACPPLHPFHVHVQEAFFARQARAWRDEGRLFHLHTPYPPRPPRDAKTVVTVHTPMAPDARSITDGGVAARLQKLQSAFLVPRERSILARADALTAVSPAVAAQLSEYGIDAGRVEITFNGVDTERFRPVVRPRGRDFLFVGRLGPRKGLEDLFDAWDLLAAHGPAPPLRLTGTGTLERSLRNRAARSELDVEFLGLVPRDDLPGLIAHARAVVVPSHYEGLPTSLLEAMAAGAPVVATRIAGITDAVPPAWRRSLVPAGDPAALARAVRRMDACRDAERRALGRVGRTHVEARFTWSRIAAHYQRIYEDVAAGVAS